MKRLFDHPVRVGWLATVIILAFAVWVGLSQYCNDGECRSKFEILAISRPNEIGDTLAGFAGALAFVWIIVTVWLQSKELAAQREELRLTRKEMKKMAHALNMQANIFKDEQRERVELRANKVLHALLDEFRECSVQASRDNEFYCWLIDAQQRYYPSPNGAPRKMASRYDDAKDPDQYIRLLRDRVLVLIRNLESLHEGEVEARDVLFRYFENEGYPESDLADLLLLLEKILETRSSVSEDTRIRISTLGIEQIKAYFDLAQTEVSRFCYIEE